MRRSLLQHVDWSSAFESCVSTNNYSVLFTNILNEAISAATRSRPQHRRHPLPSHIAVLLRTKQNAWQIAKRTGNRLVFITARRTSKAGIRAYNRNIEQRLIYAKNNSKFFAHTSQKSGKVKHQVNITVNGAIVSDKEAAGIFIREFANNYSSAACISFPSFQRSDPSAQLIFNSTETAIVEALAACFNSSSSPDGVTFKLLKSIMKYIVRPSNIIFQHSFYDGIFPQNWKQGIVIPVYKGRGEHTTAASYRPITMCSCLGMILEKVVYKQLIGYLNDANKLHSAQHGFTNGRSTIINLLQFDAYISECIAAEYPYDFVMFDFCKAFDKAPYQCVIDAAASFDLSSKAIMWIGSFRTGRTQQMQISDALSITSNVISGITQGSVIGPIFCIMHTNFLLS